jgi:predicted nucleotidyltransferase
LSVGIIPELKATIEKFGGRIELALLYGSIARGEEHAGSDIDLMVVGTLQQIDLLPVLRKLESLFRREANVLPCTMPGFFASLENDPASTVCAALANSIRSRRCKSADRFFEEEFVERSH